MFTSCERKISFHLVQASVSYLLQYVFLLSDIAVLHMNLLCLANSVLSKSCQEAEPLHGRRAIYSPLQLPL